MALFGKSTYGKGLYGGNTVPLRAPTVPVAVELFDALGTRKGYFQSGCCDLVSVEFSLAETGCKDFRLEFGSIQSISKNDKIRIRLFSSDQYFFSGVVREIPIQGSTDGQFEYAGFGLNDYFQRINTGSKTYANKTISYIVYDLLDTVITPNSLITKEITKIDALSTVLTTCTFYYVKVIDALKALAAVANANGNDYMVGVDDANNFFFRARSTDTKATLIVGKTGRYGIPAYAPKDEYEAITKYHVIRSDGTYYGAVTSTEGEDINEEKIQAPDGLSDADIANWALGQLKQHEVNQRSAAVEWKMEAHYPDVLKADGYIRIISNVQKRAGKTVTASLYGSGLYGAGLYGGEQYTGYIIDDTLKVIDVKYSITPNEAMRQITLGARPQTMEREIINVNKKLTDLVINLGR